MKTIIFTDLDGTFLDPDTYSFEAARPALEKIREKNIPLVLCSSKTRAELELYRKRLDNTHPYIAENGGGIFVPEGYFPFSTGGEQSGNYVVTTFGSSYDRIRKEFTRLRERLEVPVTGFGDMSVDEIAALTGLPRAEAALARARDFGEPFVFKYGANEEFLRALEERGMHWTQGRLFHVMGDHDKGKSVLLLKKWYEREHGKIMTIGLGDAMNDLPLLKEVDYPVLIQKNDGSYDHRVYLPGIIKAAGIGSAGWNKAVLALLNK